METTDVGPDADLEFGHFYKILDHLGKPRYDVQRWSRSTTRLNSWADLDDWDTHAQ